MSASVRSHALGLLGLFAACNAPHIPLPPPDAEDIVVEADPQAGVLVVRAEPRDGAETTSFPPTARVEIVNWTLAIGVILWADERGAFESPPLPGTLGDRVTLKYSDAESESGLLCLLVTNGRQSAANSCAVQH